MTDKQVRMVPIDCQCNRCAQEAVRADEGGPFDPRLVRMFCCVQCGNKRCPHATDHRLACTGSNEVGQEGSRYGPTLKSAAAPSVQPDREVIERLTKFANSLTGEFSSIVIPAKVAKQAAEDIRAALTVQKEEG